jgi:hypothetical protein|tara:strand:- start:1811 stop:1960 length:150 start_codon:yes stop_codon:yes gene_type:complete
MLHILTGWVLTLDFQTLFCLGNELVNLQSPIALSNKRQSEFSNEDINNI